MPRPLLFMAIAFAVCSNTYNFIDMKPVLVFGFPITAGTVLIACSYILSDAITELYGRKAMLDVLKFAVIMQLFSVANAQLGCYMTPTPDWHMNEAYVSILGQAPKAAILSAFAFYCGTSTNAFIMVWLKEKWKGKYFPARAALSTIGGEFVDGFAYVLPFFYGILPLTEQVAMVCTICTFKCCVEFFVLPITNAVVSKLKGANNDGVQDGVQC